MSKIKKLSAHQISHGMGMNGMCTEASYSYKAKGGSCQATSCTKAFAAGVVTGYKDVSTDSEQGLMSALAQQPVSIAIEADKSVFQLYKSGVLSGMCGTKLDHGVLAVGYGTATDGGDYWKVKNSWGASWGDEGYVLLKRGKGGAGECGILSDASYPIVKGSSEIVV
jgi:C1A family cysteine protease